MTEVDLNVALLMTALVTSLERNITPLLNYLPQISWNTSRNENPGDAVSLNKCHFENAKVILFQSALNALRLVLRTVNWRLPGGSFK